MASTPEGSIGNPPSGSATPVSIPQTVKEPTSQAAAPLSASANAFNPGGGDNQELLSPSAVLWGISRTTSSGAPTTNNVDAPNNNNASSASSAPGSNAGTPSKNTDASSAAGATQGGGSGGASESLGGLWNFGGFDVDALTNENNTHQSKNVPQGHHPRTAAMGRNGNNNNQGDVSGLSSAFGNFGLQQGTNNSGVPPSGMNNTYGGGYGGGNKYGGGAPQAGKYSVSKTIVHTHGENVGKDKIFQYIAIRCVYLFI